MTRLAPLIAALCLASLLHSSPFAQSNDNRDGTVGAKGTAPITLEEARARWPRTSPINLTGLSGLIIRQIEFEGLDHTRPYVAERELESRVGEPLLAETLELDRRNLERLDIFSAIHFYPVVIDDGIKLYVDVVETFPYLPTLSVQITDENGVSAGGGFKSSNLFGRAIYFSGRVLLGGATTIETVLRDPWFVRVGSGKLAYEAQYFHRERSNKISDFEETADEVYLNIQGQWSDYALPGIRLALLSIQSDRDGRTLNKDNHDLVPTLGIYYGFDSRDRIANTRQGWWNEVELMRGAGWLGGDGDYLRANLDVRRYFPIEEAYSIALFSLATLTRGEMGRDISPWQILALGGTNSIRGWELNSQSGTNQFINTAEFRWTFMPPRLIKLPLGINYSGGMHMALFGDLGIAWSEREEFRTKRFIGGYGIGLRLLLPIISVVRFDFGWGESGAQARFHIGALEKPEKQRERVR